MINSLFGLSVHAHTKLFEPCNVNEKLCFKPLLEKLKQHGIDFKTIVADAQHDSAKVRKTVEEYDV